MWRRSLSILCKFEHFKSPSLRYSLWSSFFSSIDYLLEFLIDVFQYVQIKIETHSLHRPGSPNIFLEKSSTAIQWFPISGECIIGLLLSKKMYDSYQLFASIVEYEMFFWKSRVIYRIRSRLAWVWEERESFFNFRSAYRYPHPHPHPATLKKICRSRRPTVCKANAFIKKGYFRTWKLVVLTKIGCRSRWSKKNLRPWDSLTAKIFISHFSYDL